MSEYSLGIDIGGTFTDLVIHDHESGRRWGCKVLTTHADPQQGVVDGVRTILAESGLDPRGISRVVHATTLFTNALIERKGAPTGLLVTAGFRDMLEIGRERKYDLYDIGIENPPPLVPRNLRLDVSERMRADGSVAERLDEAQLLHQVNVLRAAGVTSVALVFLHAYANPAHEEQAARAIAAHAPELFITPSHQVVREIREYERASTTVASAYVKPIAAGYLAALARELTGLGISAPLLLMQSGGGLTHAAEVNRNPVQMLESGPAAGALAAAFFGARDGVADLLAFDMGGTTAKLSLVDGGEPLVAYGFEAARQKRFIEGSGLPIRLSTIELIEIGAGGGSIARRDEIGLMKVGPDSAGSEPGPACYARGGGAPTVTDANLLLGYLNPDFFAGGTLQIDRAAAAGAIADLAETLGLSAEAAAAGIHEVVNENMAGAARVHIAERGRDPRRYALVCTGGGGPVHGYGVARKRGITRLVCPPSPGVASAWGLLVAPARVDRVTTIGFRLDSDPLAGFEAAFRELEDEAREVVGATGLPLAGLRVDRLGDGRCVGQGFDLVVPLPPGPYTDDAAARPALATAFDRGYREKFGRGPPAVPLEFINARVSVRVAAAGSHIADLTRVGDGTPAAAIKGLRRAWFAEAGGFVDTAVYDRDRLAPNAIIPGPALIEDPGSTLVVGPGGGAQVMPSGSIIVALG
ncbi:MAG TPA: hydantoinase/oxoprolinase family protein [Stellaceae bacterium]|nr:hydantoinase/oxoprolinase family protein [Stellaceae bacterium]